MELGPILQVLWRSRIGPLLLVLQIAITVAVLINAFAIVADRLGQMNRPTGIDSANQFVISVMVFRQGDDISRHVPLDLAAIRALPGVVAAAPINRAPASAGWTATVRIGLEEDAPHTPTGIYIVDEHGLDALGATLVAGRNFGADEVVLYDLMQVQPFRPPAALISRALAERLFAGDEALGRTVYFPPDVPVVVVGILDRLIGPYVDRDMWDRTIVLPAVSSGAAVSYLVRAEPGRRDAVMAEVEELLGARDPERVISGLRSQEVILARAYEAHRGMSVVLVSISGLLLAINALGVVGLASFLVNRRRQQIGTRRALGATRTDICRYFMTEMGLIALAGLAAGFLLTLIGNALLAQALDLPRVEGIAMILAAGVILILTQLAVLGPALRAASVPPALATRAV